MRVHAQSVPHFWGAVNAPHMGIACRYVGTMAKNPVQTNEATFTLRLVLAENWDRLRKIKTEELIREGRLTTKRGDKAIHEVMPPHAKVSHGSLSRIRKATHSTQLDTIASLAIWLGVDPTELLRPPANYEEIKARAGRLARGEETITETDDEIEEVEEPAAPLPQKQPARKKRETA